MPPPTVPQDKPFWKFWTTLPGVLTAIATVIGAITALIIALHPTPKPIPVISGGAGPTIQTTTAPVSKPEGSTTTPATGPVHTDWPVVAAETFTKEDSGWAVGSFPSEPQWPRLDIRIVDGEYRWDFAIHSDTGLQTLVISPYMPAVDFSVTVDVNFTDVTPSMVAVADLVFGATDTSNYHFRVTSNG